MPRAGYGNDPATPERPDAAPPEQPFEIVLLQLRHEGVPSILLSRLFRADVTRRANGAS
jgi:hypothetical protein